MIGRRSTLAWATLLALAVAGCGRSPAGPTRLHRDQPPHGGTAAALGEDYNLELVRDPAAGTLQAYVLDDEMEEFVRIKDAEIEIDAEAGGQPVSLMLRAVANPATGETVGDSCEFAGGAAWLKNPAPVSLTVKAIAVRGAVYRDVRFRLSGLAPP